MLEFWKRRTVAAAGEPDPELPPLKAFTAKITLPAISDYSTAASDQFWVQQKHPREVSPVRLRSWANAVGCADRDRLQAVCRDLENGADIGCRGPARDPTHSTNASSAFQYGAQVTNAIATWVKQGLVAGLFKTADRPRDAKINGVMCRITPNGTARVILNLSAPKGYSVNDGKNADDFPTSMSSTTRWLEILDTAAKSCSIVKVDWAAAYKHIAVRPEDIPLQYFSWLGRDFV